MHAQIVVKSAHFWTIGQMDQLCLPFDAVLSGCGTLDMGTVHRVQCQ